MDATDTNGVWARIYKFQLASHGMGAACAMAMSGIDIALWDIRGKAVGWPLYRLLGGASRAIPAYAGGISLGFQPPGALVDEVAGFVAAGYRAVKLRTGDTRGRHARLARCAPPSATTSTSWPTPTPATPWPMRGACCRPTSRRAAWLEEPFPAQDYRSYREARRFRRGAAGGRGEPLHALRFSRLIEQGAVTILQPDISKTGGITNAAHRRPGLGPQAADPLPFQHGHQHDGDRAPDE